jgi:hypothetical protein
MQGRSLLPLLRGQTPDDWRTSFYYHYYEFPGAHSVRKHYGVRHRPLQAVPLLRGEEEGLGNSQQSTSMWVPRSRECDARRSHNLGYRRENVRARSTDLDGRVGAVFSRQKVEPRFVRKMQRKIR